MTSSDLVWLRYGLACGKDRLYDLVLADVLSLTIDRQLAGDEWTGEKKSADKQRLPDTLGQVR